MACLFQHALLPGVSHGSRVGGLSSYSDEPCKRMTVYHHDVHVLHNGTNTVNATAAAMITKLVVFDGTVAAEQARSSEPVARAQGFYFYDKKEGLNAWFAFSLVFDSAACKGMLNLIGAADLMAQKMRDLSIVGGTGDFFMARGVATISTTDSFKDLYYYRSKMEIKLYECHID